MINELLSFIFYPLLDSFGVGYFVFFMAFLVSLISTLVYISLTPQSKIKRLKQEVEELNKELKLHVGNSDISHKIHSEITQKEMQIMPYVILPNILTVVPMFFIFFWMGSLLSFVPIVPNESFIVDLYLTNNTNSSCLTPKLTIPNGMNLLSVENNTVLYQYMMSGKKGNYTLLWSVNNKNYQKNLSIGDKISQVIPMNIIQDNTVNAISIEYKETKPFWFWDIKIGWLVGYIILSMCFTIILRKLFDVY